MNVRPFPDPGRIEEKGHTLRKKISDAHPLAAQRDERPAAQNNGEPAAPNNAEPAAPNNAEPAVPSNAEPEAESNV
jgi:hypothetical protein